MPQRQLVLSETERQQLVHLRDHARQPYVRERSAALLKIAEGMPAALVARQGLLRPRDPDTVYAWLDRYQATSPPISSELDSKASLTEMARRRWERFGSWRQQSKRG